MTMITPSYLGETIEYSSLHACRSTLEDPTASARSTGVSCCHCDRASAIDTTDGSYHNIQCGLFR